MQKVASCMGSSRQDHPRLACPGVIRERERVPFRRICIEKGVDDMDDLLGIEADRFPERRRCLADDHGFYRKTARLRELSPLAQELSEAFFTSSPFVSTNMSILSILPPI